MSRGCDIGERHAGARIQVEDQSAGHLGLGRCTVPGMQLEHAPLGKCRQCLLAIDRQVRFRVARNRDERPRLGKPRYGVALEELMAADTVRCPHDGAGPRSDVRHQPSAYRLVVAREVGFRNGLSIARVRPQNLVGMRDHHTHDRGRGGRCAYIVRLHHHLSECTRPWREGRRSSTMPMSLLRRHWRGTTFQRSGAPSLQIFRGHQLGFATPIRPIAADYPNHSFCL
jgi:hypothetical protein